MPDHLIIFPRYLPHAGEDVLDPRSRAGNASITRLVALANRPPCLTFSLDAGSLADLLEPAP